MPDMLTLLVTTLLALSDFKSDLERASNAYNAVQERTEKALIDADLAAAQKLFLDAVPEKERTAAHCFVLGNLWFDMDPAFAFTQHERAYALAPKEPDVQLEWALSLHRRGRHAEADAVYGSMTIDDDDQLQQVQSWRADCLARTGHYAAAAASWKLARSHGQREHIDHGFDWIYGPEDPMARRARILGELRAGNTANAEELLLGDVIWEREDEHYFVKYTYMEHDGPIVIEKLGKDSERAKDLSAIVDFLFLDWEQRFPRRDDAVPTVKLRKAAAERHWVGEGARLPESSRVARCVLDALIDTGERPEVLLKWHQEDLVKRASTPAGDPQALDALQRLARLAKSPERSKWRALAKPDAASLARSAVEEARRAKQPRAELLVRQIAAELAVRKRDLGALDTAFADLGTQPDAPVKESERK